MNQNLFAKAFPNLLRAKEVPVSTRILGFEFYLLWIEQGQPRTVKASWALLEDHCQFARATVWKALAGLVSGGWIIQRGRGEYEPTARLLEGNDFPLPSSVDSMSNTDCALCKVDWEEIKRFIAAKCRNIPQSETFLASLKRSAKPFDVSTAAVQDVLISLNKALAHKLGDPRHPHRGPLAYFAGSLKRKVSGNIGTRKQLLPGESSAPKQISPLTEKRKAVISQALDAFNSGASIPSGLLPDSIAQSLLYSQGCVDWIDQTLRPREGYVFARSRSGAGILGIPAEDAERLGVKVPSER